MNRFLTYLREAIEKDEVLSVLKNLKFDTKTVLKSGKRIAVITDRRAEALKQIMNIFSDHNPVLDKSPRTRNISSLGVIVLDSGIEIIAKPATQNVLKAEQEATKALISLIETAVDQTGKPIDILIGNKTIKNVVSAGSDHIRGDPKADIALIDSSQNEVGFISHKKEGGAASFQQYGGITSKAGRRIYENALVQEFIASVGEFLIEKNGNTVASSGIGVWREIPNSQQGKDLAARSVFGPNWDGGKSFDRESVHCIGQGRPLLTLQKTGTYELTFSEATHYPNKISWLFSGDYKAIFAASYRSGRKIPGNDLIIENMRGGIYPYDFIKGRRATEI